MGSLIGSLNNLGTSLSTSTGQPADVNLSGNSFLGGKKLDLGNSLFANLQGYNGETVEGGALSIVQAIQNDYSLRNNLDEWLFRHYLEDLGISYPEGYNNTTTNTPEDNEDPVSFGYDIIINFANSPLFNGAIEDFCNKFNNVTEINSRLGIIKEFKKQFFKFFKIDSPKLTSNDATLDTYTINNRNPQKARSYYIKKIAGLDKISESINSDSPLQFVEYKKDYLTLTLYEDVTINMGYLASLYIMLSCSRLNGKNMFPENLLRFDMTIVVTEARKFNRVNNGIEFADVISRYVYNIYECQMFFEKLSHDDTIDMTALELSSGFDMRINYKYATLEFDWLNLYDFTNNYISSIYNSGLNILNNALADFTTIPSNVTNIFLVSGSASIQTSVNQDVLNQIPTNGSSDTIVYGYYHSDSGWRNTSMGSADSTVWQDDKDTIRYELLKKTLSNIKQSLNQNTGALISGFTNDGWSYNITESTQNNNLLGSLLNQVISSFVSNLNSGFTDDGWTYNIAAYYVNRTFNSINNTISSALGLGLTSLNTTQQGSNISAETFDGLQIDSKDWLSTHLDIFNSKISPQLTLGKDGWKINSI